MGGMENQSLGFCCADACRFGSDEYDARWAWRQNEDTQQRICPHDYERFSSMADHMGVSKKALSIRMKQLGLLEQDYLGVPYDFIND